MSRAAIPDLRAIRRTWKIVRAEPRLSNAERAQRLVMRAHISEHNRRVKLEARPDAPERIAAAQAKRARKNRKRVRDDSLQQIGWQYARWRMGSH